MFPTSTALITGGRLLPTFEGESSMSALAADPFETSSIATFAEDLRERAEPQLKR